MSEPASSRTPQASSSPLPSAGGSGTPLPDSVGVVGRGRVGTALASAFRAAGLCVDGPSSRGEAPDAEVVLVCVPDAEIASAAAVVAARGTARYVGHVSGATPLSALSAARDAGAEVVALHPLQSFPAGDPPALAGVGCAVAGSSRAAVAVAEALARSVGMRPFEIDDERRASYHAAASIASNFLVTLEAAAETVALDAGFSHDEARALLAPLVRQTVENWAASGPAEALTGPVARGDEQTVLAQRAAVARAQPAILPLFDALVERTRALARAAAAAPPAEDAPLRVAA